MVLVFWPFAIPISLLFLDFIWTTFEDERQMLHDYLAETRLIRSRAKPVGAGKITRRLLKGFGVTMSYARARPKRMAETNLSPVPPMFVEETPIELSDNDLLPLRSVFFFCFQCVTTPHPIEEAGTIEKKLSKLSKFEQLP